MIQDWVATQSYMQRLMLYMNNLEFPTLIKRLKLRNSKIKQEMVGDIKK